MQVKPQGHDLSAHKTMRSYFLLVYSALREKSNICSYFVAIFYKLKIGKSLYNRGKMCYTGREKRVEP